jgi:hypothetical protein
MFDIVKKLRTLLTPEAVPGTQVDALCQAMRTQAADLKALGNALNGMVVSYEYLPGDVRGMKFEESEMSNMDVKVTLRPGEETVPEDSFSGASVATVAEATSEDTAIKEKSTYTVPELLGLAVFDALKQKPEYSGRFCTVCNATTAHFRPRGHAPAYEKTISWFCSACFLPGGFVYETVKSLIKRQGERPTT